jgi:hypothetical protein
MMKKKCLKLETEEIRFSLEALEAQKPSPTGEFENWNLHADHANRNHRDVSTGYLNVTKMIPCPPCTWG